VTPPPRSFLAHPGYCLWALLSPDLPVVTVGPVLLQYQSLLRHTSTPMVKQQAHVDGFWIDQMPSLKGERGDALPVPSPSQVRAVKMQLTVGSWEARTECVRSVL